MEMVFGKNRNQKPIVLRCPGGTITIQRQTHGTVRVAFVCEAGSLLARTNEPWHYEISLKAPEE